MNSALREPLALTFGLRRKEPLFHEGGKSANLFAHSAEFIRAHLRIRLSRAKAHDCRLKPTVLRTETELLLIVEKSTLKRFRQHFDLFAR